MDLESLISQTEALSWEDPSTQIETIQTKSPSQACLPLIGLLISQKTNNNQSVQAALNKAWDFAVPFSFAPIGPNKFLFKFSKQEHLNRILKQTTWNINGFLLVLNLWSPLVPMGDVPLKLSPFWIQIHGFPLANLTLKNAAAIGKGMGSLIQVDDCSGEHKTFRSYLRILVKLNVHNPLKPGFLFCRDDGEQFKITFKYERLDIYCTSCGRIGHKNQSCLAPPTEIVPNKYDISLKVTIFSNLPHPQMSQPSSSQSQPQTPQNTTLIIGEGSKTKDFLNHDLQPPTTIKPAKNLSLQSTHFPPTQQPPYSSPISLEPTQNSNHHHFSLNEPPAQQATSSEFQKAADHQTPLTSSLETCSMTAHPSSLFPGSISIELKQFNHGPSLASNKKAQGKKPLTSPSKTSPSPTEITNNSNTLLSPAKNLSTSISPLLALNTQTKPTTPFTDQVSPSYPPKNTQTHLNKKRHRFLGSSNPHKKGPAAPSFDLRLTEDMDTSDQTNSTAPQTNAGLSHTPPHYFKAARKGKKTAAQALSHQKTGDIELSPNPP
jgi:hypothetical protein